jgi:hypothetical protein
LSCSAGQWYFVRIRWTTTASAVIVDSEDTMLLAGEKVRYMLRGRPLRRRRFVRVAQAGVPPCPILLSSFPVSSFCCRGMLGSSILGVRSRATIVCRWSGVCLFVVPSRAFLVAMDGLGPGVCAEQVRLSLTFYTDALTRTHVNCMRVQSQVPTLLAWLHRSLWALRWQLARWRDPRRDSREITIGLPRWWTEPLVSGLDTNFGMAFVLGTMLCN